MAYPAPETIEAPSDRSSLSQVDLKMEYKRQRRDTPVTFTAGTPDSYHQYHPCSPFEAFLSPHNGRDTPYTLSPVPSYQHSPSPARNLHDESYELYKYNADKNTPPLACPAPSPLVDINHTETNSLQQYDSQGDRLGHAQASVESKYRHCVVEKHKITHSTNDLHNLVCFGTIFTGLSSPREVLQELAKQYANCVEPYASLTRSIKNSQVHTGGFRMQFLNQQNASDFAELQMDSRLSQLLQSMINTVEQKDLRLELDCNAILPLSLVQSNTVSTGKRKTTRRVNERDMTSISATMQATLTLYGDGKLGESIGDYLSHHDIYLQHPVYPREGLPYCNPHYLTDESDGPIITEHSLSGGIRESSSCEEMEVDEAMMIRPSLFDQMFVTEETSLAEENKTVIATELKSHQRQALFFMKQLELNSRKNETTGGILGDDMGMGKTLSILSLLAEPQSVPSASSQYLPSKSTLIIAPLSVLGNWEDQKNQHTHPNSLSLLIYHGSAARCTLLESIANVANYDIVCTTYNTITHEYRKTAQKNGKSALHCIAWNRIILDEAHEIRNTATKKFQAVHALKSRYRWCISGTPIQNSVEDIGALFQFLRYRPLESKQAFKKEIVAPLAECSHEGYMRLRTALQHLCLRRMKSGIPGLLPPKKLYIKRLVFSEHQRALYNRTKAEFIKGSCNVSQSANPSGSTFQMIMKLRQICDHGEELLSASQSTNGPASPNMEGIKCCQCTRPIASCQEEIEALENPRCSKHATCEKCLDSDKAFDCEDSQSEEIECKDCALLQFGSGSDLRTLSAYQGPSVKVKALLSAIEKDKQLRVSNGGPVKHIVFSCWTRMLDLIEIALRDNDVAFVRIDGNMSRTRRNESIEMFNENTKPIVILVSLMAGGTGINLTRASRVHIMEPHWNPMVEQQAAGRCYRIGQKEEVIVTKYVMEDSFEMNMLELQQRKLEIASNSLDVNTGAQIPSWKECKAMLNA
ncbi:hypothetical protein BJ508DRAFT_414637 [Ascobolus immersus RN42]|uniref:P-loop containing nucleoside triphosphate hydrolase protein n=1 Tax=Ascobolus immersus RN42 TaxID=1160509 RepID=A0A3N4I6M8_ASCIM|nr:hypothetical protein BJ508DRAFT_414637 [Ascobolus immersus RN42]